MLVRYSLHCFSDDTPSELPEDGVEQLWSVRQNSSSTSAVSLRSGPLSPSLQKSMAILPIMLGLHDGASKRPGLAGVRPGCRTSQSITQTSEPGEPSSLVTAALATLKRAGGPTTRGCSMSFVTHSSLALEHDSRGRRFNNVQMPAVWQSNNRRFEKILEYA
jgi:hypothetical protein